MALNLANRILPSWKNAALALLAAGLLILAFPDFEYWFLAWFALVPLMWAVEREGAVVRSFILGWFFGTAFFFGTCWWLTYAPIHYAGFPWPLAYFLILIVCIGAGVFPGIFAAVLSILLKRFGSRAFLAAPFVWVFSEFLRYWLTGNNWNAIGYSQAFSGRGIGWAAVGGIEIVGFVVLLPVAAWVALISAWPSLRKRADVKEVVRSHKLGLEAQSFRFSKEVLQNEKDLWTRPVSHLQAMMWWAVPFITFGTLGWFLWLLVGDAGPIAEVAAGRPRSVIVAVQPNVPMSGVDYTKLNELRQRQFDVAEAEIKEVRNQLPVVSAELPAKPITVVLPESPMNFMYNDDREFQQYVRDFTTRNNVSILFNSAEPDATNGKYFNSAMMIGPDGKPVAQYDKIYLLPFGEAVPVPFESILPAFVGNFSYGREYDLLPLGEAKAGVMICFESHFGQLSREYVRNGADAIIEMTNDGYLGPTPVLRQHLANAVFRAVETNRPVLRVTNVGITAYIDERGNVHDPLPPYSEGTRVWSVSKSDGSQTFYVRYGDWFAWLCSIITVIMLGLSTRRRRNVAEARA